MGISPDKLAKIINHNSKTLCNENAQNALSKMEKSKQGGVSFTDVDPNNFHDEWDNFSLSSPGETSSTPMYESYNPSAVENSKMPDFIKESMLNNPISTPDAMKGVMDKMNSMQKQNASSNFSQLMENKQPIKETMQQPNAGSIDYNYLKYIISECIREELSKQPLNESTTLKQIGLSGGKIKLVDNKGNIFSAQLQLEGNIKDKKKKES